ncbi:hypothetical protein M3Y96_01239200 [Aphelenchoides besseyi]|nr:hypothetical protein M3Y96_01239200 [Aphelenchoides besseyi]
MISKFALLFLFLAYVTAKEQLFKPRGRFFDKKFRLLIEDFYSKTDVETQTQIDELLMGVSLANETNGNSDRFYSTAFTNLKNAVPKLETLNLDGGYVLKPAFKTADELRYEIEYLREHIAAVIRSAHEHHIDVPTLIVGVGYLFNPKIADQIDLRSLIARTFAVEPTRDPQLYEFTFSFNMDGVRCQLAITISDIGETSSIPRGRTPFIAFTRLPSASMDSIARLYYNHKRVSGRFDP